MYSKAKSNSNKNWQDKIFRVDIFPIHDSDTETQELFKTCIIYL